MLRNAKGFSLFEILIALSLLAVIMTFTIGKFTDSLNNGKAKSAGILIKTLADNIKQYDTDCNRYPTTDQGLEALVQKPADLECKRYQPGGYVDKVPLDPWDKDFIYQSDGKTFTIMSLGKDGEEGGEGYDADISSANL
jgi:general secretion pathway protein G